MPAETPNPTPAQVFADARAVTPRSSRIVREVKRRLKACLPELIEQENADNGWDGEHTGIVPLTAEEVQLAPAYFDDDCYINTVSIAWNYQSEPLTGNVFRQHGQLLVFSIDEMFEDEAQIERSFDRVELVQMFLSMFTKGCVGEDGVTLWRKLEHATTSLIPPEVANGYAGAMASFNLKLTPTANGR